MDVVVGGENQPLSVCQAEAVPAWPFGLTVGSAGLAVALSADLLAGFSADAADAGGRGGDGAVGGTAAVAAAGWLPVAASAALAE